jgi:hypothetical protein
MAIKIASMGLAANLQKGLLRITCLSVVTCKIDMRTFCSYANEGKTLATANFFTKQLQFPDNCFYYTAFVICYVCFYF